MDQALLAALSVADLIGLVAAFVSLRVTFENRLTRLETHLENILSSPAHDRRRKNEKN